MDKTFIRGATLAVFFIIVCIEWTKAQGVDLTTVPQTFGTAVVEATVQKINQLTQANGNLQPDNRMIRRIAWVETEDGTVATTYSDLAYHGGIWKVDRSVFDATLGMYNNPVHAAIFNDIKKIFDISWSQISWSDCRVPLYSALAARLYLHSLEPTIPRDLDGQAVFWRDTYHLQPPDTAENFVLKVSALESTGCSVGGIDLVFVLDSSGSVGSSNFQTTKNFVLGLVDFFDIGTDRTRVGVIKYSSAVTVEFNLNGHTDDTSLSEAIASIGYVGGGTNTVSALETMADSSFLVENGARPGSKGIPRVAVVITDGQSQGAEQVAVPADRARENGVVIFAIGVTDNVNQDELNAIANKPNDTYIFHVINFDAITAIADSLEYNTCNQPTQILDPVINATLIVGEVRFLQETVTNEGITLALEAPEGNVVMFVSTTISNPNEALHDFRLEAMEGEGAVELFIGPEHFNQTGTSDSGDTRARRRRQAASLNETEAGTPIGTVYMTIEGLQDTNDFVLMVAEGDVTEPTTAGVTTTKPTTNGQNAALPTPTNGCGLVGTTVVYLAMIAMNALFTVKLMAAALY